MYEYSGNGGVEACPNTSWLRYKTCGSGLARESGVSDDINVGCAAAFAGKSDRRTAAPTWIAFN
jgi:hypothetical protein